MVILRCLCGSEVVLLAVVIGKWEMSSTHISQENEHVILVVKCQFMSFALSQLRYDGIRPTLPTGFH